MLESLSPAPGSGCRPEPSPLETRWGAALQARKTPFTSSTGWCCRGGWRALRDHAASLGASWRLPVARRRRVVILRQVPLRRWNARISSPAAPWKRAKTLWGSMQRELGENRLQRRPLGLARLIAALHRLLGRADHAASCRASSAP